MRITPDHVRTFLQQGFVIIPNFLTAAETRAGREAYNQVFPNYAEWARRGKPPIIKNKKSGVDLFPWVDTRLNDVATHPDIIYAAEQIIGTREIRLCDAELSVRYSDQEVGTGLHYDYVYNTLGPFVPHDRSNLSFIINLEEITAGHSPTYMVPYGKSDSEGVHMIVPEGSVCIYSSTSTRHGATPFKVSEAYRANMWTMYSRKDRLWDGGRWFSYKGGVPLDAMSAYIGKASTRQLELIGFPPPGDPLWTDEFLAGMAERYPGFDPSRYRAKLAVAAV